MGKLSRAFLERLNRGPVTPDEAALVVYGVDLGQVSERYAESLKIRTRKMVQRLRDRLESNGQTIIWRPSGWRLARYVDDGREVA